jgi:hypothetical protein
VPPHAGEHFIKEFFACGERKGDIDYAIPETLQGKDEGREIV